VAAWSKAWVCGRSLAEIVGSNTVGGVDVVLMSVVCCQVEVSATGRSFVQRSAIECGVSKAGITRGYCTRYSPASERTGSKLAMPLARGMAAETGQSASSTLSSNIPEIHCFVTRYLLAVSVTVSEFAGRIVY
jgi:hypothetical protein